MWTLPDLWDCCQIGLIRVDDVNHIHQLQDQCTRYYNSLKLAFAEGHCNSARCAAEGAINLHVST